MFLVNLRTCCLCGGNLEKDPSALCACCLCLRHGFHGFPHRQRSLICSAARPWLASFLAFMVFWSPFARVNLGHATRETRETRDTKWRPVMTCSPSARSTWSLQGDGLKTERGLHLPLTCWWFYIFVFNPYNKNRIMIPIDCPIYQRAETTNQLRSLQISWHLETKKNVRELNVEKSAGNASDAAVRHLWMTGKKPNATTVTVGWKYCTPCDDCSSLSQININFWTKPFDVVCSCLFAARHPNPPVYHHVKTTRQPFWGPMEWDRGRRGWPWIKRTQFFRLVTRRSVPKLSHIMDAADLIEKEVRLETDGMKRVGRRSATFPGWVGLEIAAVWPFKAGSWPQVVFRDAWAVRTHQKHGLGPSEVSEERGWKRVRYNLQVQCMYVCMDGWMYGMVWYGMAWHGMAWYVGM